jgi:hypothetical protein
MYANSESETKSEFVALVDWLVTVPRTEARFKRKSGLYTPQKVRASLENQPITVQFLEEQFGINFSELLA